MTTGSKKDKWILTSPEGKTFEGASPINCCRLAKEKQISVEQQLENLLEVLYNTCCLCDAKIHGLKYYLGKGTPSDIGPLCSVCVMVVRTGRIMKSK